MHIKVYLYRCMNKTCKDEVREKCFEGTIPPMAFHCVKCGLGRGRKLEVILQQKVGVLPVLNPDGSHVVIEEYDTPDMEVLRNLAGPGHGRVVVK